MRPQSAHRSNTKEIDANIAYFSEDAEMIEVSHTFNVQETCGFCPPNRFVVLTLAIIFYSFDSRTDRSEMV